MAVRSTKPCKMMLPKEGVDMAKWAVVACDQYTSEPEYWKEVNEFVGDAPSTVRITLPEIYLEGDDVAERTEPVAVGQHLDTIEMDAVVAGVENVAGPVQHLGMVGAPPVEHHLAVLHLLQVAYGQRGAVHLALDIRR